MLEILKNNKFINSLLITTTDKVYRNNNRKKLFNENDELGGDDIYSASKSAIEIITNAYNESFFKKSKNQSIITLRAGNVIGGGDWAKDRIIPDCIRSIEKKKKIILRSPKSIRPWQHVLEPLMGYLIFYEKTYKNKKISEKAFNFGPKISNCVDVKTLTKTLLKYLIINNKIKIKKTNDHFYEKKYLFLNSKKVKQKIKWNPILSFSETIKLTADWYKKYLDKKNMEFVTKSQVVDYLKKYYGK